MNLRELFKHYKKNDSASDESSAASRYQDYARIVEMLVFAFFAPVVGLLLFKNDPMGINAGFPWAAVGPVIFAARYGSSWGFACAAATAIAILLPNPVYEGQMTSLLALAIGTVVLAIIVGDSSTSWRERSGQAEAENQYLRHRLKEFSKDYHVLKVSHGQLEEFTAGQRLSLRQALQQLKPVLSSSKDGLEAGSELMAIFAQFCSVQIAGLYSMKSEKLTDETPIATHGKMTALPQFDPLLKMAIKERRVVSIKLDALATDQHDSSLLAVVPIADSSDHLHGVLAIRDMHFMAFQQENLNVLSLLGGYIGDMLTRSKGLGASRAGWFLAELDTALRFARTNSVQSSLLCIDFKRFDRDREIADYLSTNIRSLDASWLPPSQDGACTVVILLPLISQTQCEAYINRVKETLLEKYELDLEKMTKSIRTTQISRSDNRQSCLKFIDESTGVLNAVGNSESDDSTGVEGVA